MILIGLPACARTIGSTLQHHTPARYAAAILGGSGGVPVIIPPIGAAALPLLDRLDGLLLPGSPSNVEPHHYGVPESETPEWHDPARDGTTFPLIHAAIERGMPILAICRGIQELNVALGGSLHQRVHAVPDRLDHRGHGTTQPERYAPAHGIQVTGQLARLLGRTATTVNSVHGQAIDRPAPGLAVEATAPDGTVEAVSLPGHPFAIGVQWHPEYAYAENQDSLALFHAFGDACRAYAAGRSAP